MKLHPEIDPGLSGLEQLRDLLARGRRIGMAETLAISLAAVEPGEVAFEAVPDARALNPFGRMHGGYAATLLDYACGFAVWSRLEPGQGLVTIEMKVAYHRAIAPDTGPLRCEGRVVSFGRRTGFSEGALRDGAGKLLASATSSFLVMALDGAERPGD